MEKIHLKYYNDKEYRKPIECDFGPAWEILWQGAMYAYKKNDINHAMIIFLTHLSVTVLAFMVAPIPIAIIISVLFVLFINFLFAVNYNMIVIEALLKEGYLPMDTFSSEKLIEKGIYFKLQ